MWTKTQLCVQYVCVCVCEVLPPWDPYIIKPSNLICLNLSSLLILFNSARVLWRGAELKLHKYHVTRHFTRTDWKPATVRLLVLLRAGVTLPAAWKTGWPSALFMVITETLTSRLGSSPPPSSHALTVRHYNGQSNSHDGVTASSAHRCSAVTSAVPTERGVNCQH